MSYKPPFTEWYNKMDVKPPDSVTHGTDEDIRSKLKPTKMWGWKLEGNRLSCNTDMGKLVQSIPTNMILVGETPEGMPILQKMVS
jgi:hypothetical protein